MHTKSLIRPFSNNPDFDADIRGALGKGVGGAGDPGEILAAVAHVDKNDHEAWFDAWLALGDRVATTANSSATAGHTVSAAGAYLRASAYYANAVDAASALADDRLGATFDKQMSAWEQFIVQTPANVTEIAIPYEDRALRGWLFRPAGPAALTLVIVNGSDGSLASLWGGSGAAALARGYNVVVFDGPGQQSELFQKGTSFRPDWEHVLTPVYDFISGIEGIDPARIAAYGISQGSYWVTRALAFEHRFAAAITDPGIVDVATSWTSHIPHNLLKLLDEGKTEKFDKEMAFGMKFSPTTNRTWQFRARPYGTPGYAETIATVRRYTVAEVAGQITTPLLILSPENEQFWPGQAEQLAALTSTVSTVVRFTAAEGADGHCQPLARTLTAQRMFDWLDERV
ncbi:alpha/beta hydrolase family protein [Gordonia sp. NPDC003429]